MASIRDRTFSIEEMRTQVAAIRAYAHYAWTQNKQEHYERYETVALALEQALAEIDRLTNQRT